MFSLSLVGRGFDCHRTWESLILGNIVLLQSSPLDPLFEGLPVVIIKDWSEINEGNLMKWAAKYGDASSNPKYRERLSSAFWVKMLKADIQAAEQNLNREVSDKNTDVSWFCDKSLWLFCTLSVVHDAIVSLLW